MKRYLIIFTLLLGAVCSRGQSGVDQATVLQKIVDLPELQKYYPKSDDGQFKQVCVMQYGTNFQSDIAVTKFGKGLLLLQPDQIKERKIEAYFAFRSFGMDKEAVNTSLVYFYDYNYASGQFKMLKVSLELHKAASGWNISNLNIGGDK